MNLPNTLTLLRILLVPAFLIAVIYHSYVAALTIFIVAGITDLLDGLLARILRQETALGFYLDPVADKLLITVSFIALSVQEIFPAWLAVITVSKDIFVSLGVGFLHFSGQKILSAPTFWGKQTTFLQIVTLGFTLLWIVLGRQTSSLVWLFIATGILTGFSGLHYVARGLRSLPSEVRGNGRKAGS